MVDATAHLQQIISERWPGRQAQVMRLLALLGPAAHSVPNLFVYGLPSTGKTSVVRDCLSELGRRHAYVQCTETMKPKQLLSSIYTQLQGHKRKTAEGYAGLTIDSMVSFISELPEVCKPQDRTSVVVLDDAHWLARTSLLAELLQVRECSGGASVAFVLISQQAWGCGEFEELACMPTIHFPNYTLDQMATTLVKICSFSAPLLPEAVRHALCEQVVSTFRDVTQDVMDLATLAMHLWPCYTEPLVSGKVSLTDSSVEQVTRRLYSPGFRSQLQAVCKMYEPGMRSLPLACGTGGGAAMQQQVYQPATALQRQQLLELPQMTKLLVIASYIASYNKPTLDQQIFDVKTRAGRMRRHGANMDSDRQVEAAKEARLKGPHSFPLQRLLTCLSYLQSGREVVQLDMTSGRPAAPHLAAEPAAEPSGAEHADWDVEMSAVARASGSDQGAGGCSVGRYEVDLGRVPPWWRRQEQEQGQEQGQGQRHRRGHLGGSTCESADVLVHLSTLAAMQLLSKAECDTVDPLDGSKYTCHISEEYAAGMAESLGLRLADYVKYV